MKSKFFGLFTTATMSLVLLAGCSNVSDIFANSDDFSENPTTSYLGERAGELVTIPTELIIHYQMDGASNADAYAQKRFYVWAGGADGVEMEADGVDDFGMYISLDPSIWPAHDTFNFIIKIYKTWQGQSTDTSVKYEQFPPDEEGKLEIWCIDGEGGSIEVYATKAETLGDKMTYAKFKDWKTIRLEGTGDFASYKLYALTPTYQRLNPSAQKIYFKDYLFDSSDTVTNLAVEGSDTAKAIEIPLLQPVRPNVTYYVQVKFASNLERQKSKYVGMETLYNTSRFKVYYTYEGEDLGVTYTKEKSTFKLWAPTCSNVQLRLYDSGTPGYISGSYMTDSYRVYELSYAPGGIYTLDINEDLNGKYYTYYVTNTEGASEVVDPYARATGVNGVRGEILDLDTTDPEGWDELPLVWDGVEGFDIGSTNELTPYEIHIADLTMDDTWTGESKPGTYKAFAEKGTSYTQDGYTVKTGFDHIEELGVNAIQILPFFDQDNNEVTPKFNWGYNPLNYNAVDGGYSTDPYDGATSVKEMKELVMAYANNANHTRVIMDVVYNHVSSVASSNLTKICPKYYFRINSDGSYATGSGCGNETKSEAPMMRKLIVESVKYWATEYKIKGFRFDLMGLIDVVTMRQVKDAIYAIDKDNVVYGEGWTGGGYAGTVRGTDSSAVYNVLYPTETSAGVLAAFNDGGRNSVRGSNDGGWGSTDKHPGYGFISQGAEDVGGNGGNVGQMLKGINPYNGGSNPIQTVNYVSCHDNYTVYDQLNWTLSDDGHVTAPSFATVAEASVACHAAVMFSQGISFIQGGEELFRTKIEDHPELDLEKQYYVDMYGINISHNSYKSSYECNSFKWDRKIAVQDGSTKVMTHDYCDKFREMISARKEFKQLFFSDNCDKISLWGTDSGSTMIAANIGGTGTAYNLFFSGRVGASLSFEGATSATLLFNSRVLTNGISLTDSSISLNKMQFVAYKL